MVAVKEKVLFSKQIAEFEIKTDEQAIRTEELLEEVLEAVISGEEELRPFMGFLEYELEKYKKSFVEESVSGADVLRFLMNQHGHVQADLCGIIARSTVSELLTGKRNFTMDHIRKLGEFYKVSPKVFLPLLTMGQHVDQHKRMNRE